MDQSQLIPGRIFDVQGFSVHDGPGCRTLIFLKGCSLKCDWCSNPEGINHTNELIYKTIKCSHDNLCIAACEYSAITANSDEEGSWLKISRFACTSCETYSCVSACHSGALSLAGYNMSLDEIYTIINRDRQYWGSQGGITLTGGEPFLQPDFTVTLLKQCYNAYIHTAVETCGNVPWGNIEPALPFLDWIFFDLKTMDPKNSHHLTGYASKVSAIPNILDNASRLAQNFHGRLIFRMPVIPGFNDTEENIVQTAYFIKSTGRCEVNILPLHHLGREKYNLLGRKYYTDELKIPDKNHLLWVSGIFISMGIKCYTGSETPF